MGVRDAFHFLPRACRRAESHVRTYRLRHACSRNSVYLENEKCLTACLAKPRCPEGNELPLVPQSRIDQRYELKAMDVPLFLRSACNGVGCSHLTAEGSPLGSRSCG